MSKGDKDRTTDREAFRRSWEKIFGKRDDTGYEDVVLPDGSIGRKVKPIEPSKEEDKK